MNNLFISYRWGDRKSDDDFGEVVKEIEQSSKLTVFWDARGLHSENFIHRLKQEVRDADLFMPVVTKSYIAFGEEGGREKDKDFCLLEYAAAVAAGKRIVPIFCGVEGKILTVSCEEAQAAAERVLKLDYTAEDVTVLQTYLCSQNGVAISEVDAQQIRNTINHLCSLVFDTFCRTKSEIAFYKKYLDDLAAKLDPVRVFGDFDDGGLTLSKSYTPLSFLCHLTKAEEEEKERRKESTAPTDVGEEALLTDLENEKLAVIVGDAGQGKSSFAKHLTIQLAQQAQQNGLSRELFFPLYVECKNLSGDSFSSPDDFLTKLAQQAAFSQYALEAVMRFGKPLFIFDAMDEVPPGQMDALIEAIYRNIYLKNKTIHQDTYILFTSRPGQKLVAGNDDMTLDNDRVIVRKYSVKEFSKEQRDGYIGKLADAKKTAPEDKHVLIEAIEKKEAELADYHCISRNPFMLFAVFSTYIKDQELPGNRFDAICRVIDDIIERDLKKRDYRPLKKKNIKEVLGAVSCLFYHQRDSGKTPHASMQTPYDLAERIYDLDDSNREDRRRLDQYSLFFENNTLLDENGFRHEFLAATYAAYYLLFLMKKKNPSPREAKELSALKKDTDYWKSVTEALLCLIDREGEDNPYIEPLLKEMQQEEAPDYDTLCNAVSQFINNQPRSARMLLQGMLDRGCEGILNGEQRDAGILFSGRLDKDGKLNLKREARGSGFAGFVCQKGVNPYEELFYYPAIYPYLQEYLSELNPGARQGEELYLCRELIKEVCALFSEDERTKLKAVYHERAGSEYAEINTKLKDAACRWGNSVRGYAIIQEDSEPNDYGTYCGSIGLTNIFLPDNMTEIGDYGNHMFGGCTSLKKITIPDGVTRIHAFAFTHCRYLEEIIIPDSMNRIGMGAFGFCANLKRITIPINVTILGGLSFVECTSLMEADILGNLKELPLLAFANCTNLTRVTIPAGVTRIADDAFDNCPNLTIHAPKGSYAEAYAKEKNIPFVAE